MKAARIDRYGSNDVVRVADIAVPINLTFEEAASLPLVALTAWQALVETGKLAAHQRE